MDGRKRTAGIRAVKFESLKLQQENKNRRRRVFYITLVAIAALSFFVVVFTVLLKVGEIQVVNSTIYTEEEIISALPVTKGDSLYGFDNKNVEESLKQRFPYIKAVSVTRKLPETVIIEITEEIPTFGLKVEKDYYILSEGFKVLDRVETLPEDVKLVILDTGYVKRCVAGEKLSFAEKRLLDSIDELWATLCHYNLDKKTDYIKAANRFDIHFGYNNQIKAYLGDIKDCDTKIRFFIGIMDHIYDDQRGKLDISNPREATFSPFTPSEG